ncbi:MAG TPA: RNA polymerase sigma factor FliA [Vicinamibacterales bacterium]|nr:RNA polymerase sigma factor FliA [Vicinamibacterales bacterium]
MRMIRTATTTSQENRDELVMNHVNLVRSMANRLARRLPSQVEVSELVSVGILGLIDAAGRYRPSLGVPFDAFARRRIHGAMLDALRELDWAPRSVRKAQRELDGALAQLRHLLGREPREEEVAQTMHLSTDDYRKVLDQLRTADLAVLRSTDAGNGDDARPAFEIAIDDSEGPHALLERSELKSHLVAALGDLPERERHILALYYEEELTLAEIGAVIGVGESRVSQLRTQAIARLRSAIQARVAATRPN